MKKIFTSYIYIFLLTLFSFVLVSCGGSSSGGGTYSIAPTSIPEGENSGYGSGSGVWYTAHDIKNLNSYIYSLEYTPDAKKLAVGTWGQINIYDASNGYTHLKKITEWQQHVWDIAFSPDGKKLVTVLGDGTMRVWSTSSYSVISSVHIYGYGAYSVDFTSNGERAITVGSNSGKDAIVKVWDMTVNPPNELATFSNGVATSNNLGVAATHHDGKYIAFGGGNKISIVDITDLNSPSVVVSGYTVSSSGTFIRTIAFHPDGKTLVVPVNYSLHYFDVTNLPTITKTKTNDNGGGVAALSYSQDGSLLTVAGGMSNVAMIWNGDTKQIADGNEYAFICSSPDPVRKVATKPDGTEFVFDVDKSLQVWKKYEY